MRWAWGRQDAGLRYAEAEAEQLFRENPFKLHNIKLAASRGEELTVYRMGNFVDLCTGPHIASTGLIKGMKLTDVGGHVWASDPDATSVAAVGPSGASQTDTPLQRVYGVVCTTAAKA